MPTYEYICTSCDHVFERFESMTAKPNASCPACKKRHAKRCISGGAGFIFKGSGFYTTDYRSSSYASDAKKDTSSSSSTDKSGASTVEATSKSTSDSTPSTSKSKTNSTATPTSEKKSTAKSA